MFIMKVFGGVIWGAPPRASEADTRAGLIAVESGTDRDPVADQPRIPNQLGALRQRSPANLADKN